MVGHSSLFCQVLLLVNRHQFAGRVKECCAEKAAKGFSCWSQFVAMMSCQLAQAKSLREIIDGLACCEGKLNHLGLQEAERASDPGQWRTDPPGDTSKEASSSSVCWR
jgi:Domain of unknown function (DUF4372)